MKIVQKDEKRKAQEEAERERAALEEIKRIEFIQTLKESRKFQRYVIEELLQGEIDKLSDIRKFTEDTVSKTTPEEAHRILLANLKAVKILEKIIGKLS